ncbi:MAG: hypothetical protein LWX83_15830 [Anaerolineae bacterium]|nr:hypothetical protein [Anaerolineae bacterium]
MKKYRIPFELILALVVIAANIYVVFAPANSLMNWYTTDDAFYYFKTAQNFTEGHGLSFDGISRSGGFHPLWMMVCIPVFSLARFDLVLPLRILALISILVSALGGVYFYKLISRVVSKPVAVLVSLFWMFEPRIHGTVTQLGMEASVNALFIILLLYQTALYEADFKKSEDNNRRMLWIGITAIFTVLSRLDNIFLVIMVGIWLVFRRPNLRLPVIIDSLIIACSVFVSYFLRVGFQDNYQPFVTSASVMVITALVVKLLVFYAGGLYGRKKASTLRIDLLRIIIAVSIGSLITGGLMFVLPRLGLFSSFPRTVIISDWVLSLLAILIFRWMYSLTTRQNTLLPVIPEESILKQNWKRWLILGLNYYGPVGLVMLAYIAFYKWYFGTFSPVSGQIKHWWGSIYTVYGRPTASIWEFFGFPERPEKGAWGQALSYIADAAKNLQFVFKVDPNNDVFYNNAYMGFLILFGGIILALVVLNWNRICEMVEKVPVWPLFAGCLAQIINYTGTNYVNMRSWYWVGEMVLIVLLFALLLEIISNLAQERLKIKPAMLQSISVLLGMVLIVQFAALMLQQVPPTVVPENEEAYRGGMWILEQHTEPGSIIGSTGGGVIAYFIHDRTIVNMDGLMNSDEYFQMMENREAYKYYDRIGMDYVYANPTMMEQSEPYMWMILSQIKPIGSYGGATLYHYIPTGK